MKIPSTRRELLRALSVGGGVALAGCGGFESGEPTDSREETAGGTSARGTTVRTRTREAARKDSETTAEGATGGESSSSGGATTARETTAVDDATAETSLSEPRVSVENVAVEPATIRQGATATVRVELSNTGGAGDPHPLALSAAGTELRRTRLATEADSTLTTSFTVQCDRAGTREFVAGGERASVTVERWPESFVTVDGTDFVLDGEPFPVVGTNNAYLHHKTAKTVDEIFRDAAEMGLNVVRLLVNGAGTDVGYCREFACGRSQYGLQPGPREYDEASFRRLDYVIASAKRHGIRLIPSLITRSPGGVESYVEWVDGAETHDDFYANEECRAIYRDYLEQVVTRENTYTGLEYREDPTVMLWEVANEPELDSSIYGEPLQDWIAEMAGHVETLDSNHPISAGLIGWNDPGNESDYLACFESDAIDAASTHMYYDAKGIDDWVERHATGVHEELGVPLYVGEFGWDATRAENDYERQLRNRNEGFERWYDQFERHDVAGSLFWFLLGHLDDGTRFPDHDGFGVYYPEDADTADVVESAAERYGAASAASRAASAADNGTKRGPNVGVER